MLLGRRGSTAGAAAAAARAAGWWIAAVLLTVMVLQALAIEGPSLALARSDNTRLYKILGVERSAPLVGGRGRLARCLRALAPPWLRHG